MQTKDKKPKYLRVKDREGNEFLCPLESMKRVEEATEDELEECVEGDVVGRYAGNIEVEK